MPGPAQRLVLRCAPRRPAGQKSRFYGANGEQCGVEELALQFYASEEGGGWQGTHRRAIQLLLLLLCMGGCRCSAKKKMRCTCGWSTVPLRSGSRSRC